MLKSLSFTMLVVSVESENLSLLSEQLHKKRLMAPDFFSNAPIVVQIENSSLEFDFNALHNVVREQGFMLSGISGDLSEQQTEAIHRNGIATLTSSIRQPRKKEPQVSKEIETVESESPQMPTSYVKTIIHSGRVRSGQQIYAKEGDLVINGDVGAGAEVIADGNIHIYGTLRGKALAGAMGEQNASIFCISMLPELVSIAGVYTLSEDLPPEYQGKSCIVSLVDKHIKLANLLQN
ncbi:septum site-determining protein MinC [Desulfosediminicola flagellatus]|uniref:septum site-determining protein MinC n=1 Tax=Desulfosediminicola flagellatus TaxID=2569541 RepID=UPI0010AD7E14|nr:septum site-determining protein MinC [Desulfosediminicola flagellatus]